MINPFGNTKFNKIRLNHRTLMKDIIKSSRVFHKSHVYPVLQKSFDEKKEEFIKEYDNHNITQEMYAGADNPNANFSGGPLGGLGNIFSFFGFRDGDDPAFDLRKVLIKGIYMHKNYRVKKTRRGIIYTHRVILPNMQEIFSQTPLRWTSRSWVKAVETGISGYQYFLRGYRNASRSAGGFQSKHQIRSGKFNNQKYLSSLYNQFVKRINKPV